jgi:hypothetical protein
LWVFISLIDVDIFARPHLEFSIGHFLFWFFSTSQWSHISCWYLDFEFPSIRGSTWQAFRSKCAILSHSSLWTVRRFDLGGIFATLNWLVDFE